MKLLSEDRVQGMRFEVLFDQHRIARRVAEMGRQITKDYADKIPVLIGVLKGGVVFLTDLIREIRRPIELEFVWAASYRYGTTASSRVELGGELSVPLKGRHVLIVEGVVDSGKTVSVIRERICKQEPASVEVATLIDKPASHRAKLNIKYKGFSIGNDFVIGFGLDNTQRFRNLPFVGRVLEP